MLWWLVDNATVFYVIGGLTALMLAAIYWSNRRGKYLRAAGIFLGLIALVFLLTRIVITDRKQLELNVLAMAEGVEEGAPAKVLRHFSREFRHEFLDPQSSRDWAARVIRQRRVSDIHISNFDIEKLSREDRQAQVHFQVSFNSPGADGRIMYRCRIEFVLEGEEWRLKVFKLFNFGSDHPLTIPM